MKILTSATGLSARIWFITSAIFSIGAMTASIIMGQESEAVLFLFGGFIAAILGSVPVLIGLFIAFPILQSLKISWQKKFWIYLISIQCVALLYGLIPALLGARSHDYEGGNSYAEEFFMYFIGASQALFAAACIATAASIKLMADYFSKGNANTSSHTIIFQQLFYKQQKTTTIMDYETAPQAQPQQQRVSSNSNSILIKGIITGVLILVMLVPTFFINSLITERENRQKEVVKEVSSKWAEAQTLSAPFITVPYNTQFTDTDGKLKNVRTNLILLADQLAVNGTIKPEVRPRSIYKVLLYKSDITFKGSFKPEWPADINIANVDFANAKLCFALSDYKGIEEEIFINYNNEKLLLNPGLPITDLGEVGLSVPFAINAELLKSGVPFSMQIKLKGSEQLHFLPLSTNSKFDISSTWASPSFDGNSLPNERKYNDSGFNAKWNFNRANLPFGTVIREGALKASTTAFGVSLVQPADQYNKTSRSVKYAILLIGLTFALFFIIELMQKKPLHPVQYILVGLALVIFYTLLLSISEYILFDYAYSIAAAATILLITFYAKSHFNSWKSASIFGALLTCLYGFIFILIRLEDTALLVGSIGLFIILALVMYGSRKINWYGNSHIVEGNQSV
jgi:inner membrane protein